MTLGFRTVHHLKEDENKLLQTMASAVSPELLQTLIEYEEMPDDEVSVSFTLHRFLAAEKWSVDAAITRLEGHAEWRKEAVPKGGIPEASVQAQIMQQKILLQPNGPDGRPLLIIRVNHHFPTTTAECEQFVIYCLEAASRMCDRAATAPTAPSDGKMWAVFDLKSIKWANLDRHALFSCFNLLNRHFPERIHKIFMVDSPLMFDALWKIVSPFVDATTRQKVGFVRGHERVSKEVDASVLPVAYGGIAEEVPVEVAVRESRRGGGGLTT